MKDQLRRLEKVEAALRDNSGCVPHGQEWFAYWAEQAEQLLAGKQNVPVPPIAFFDAVLHGERRRAQQRNRDAASLAGAGPREAVSGLGVAGGRY